MKKLKVGVVGLGFIGIIHVEQLRRLGFVDVVAATDSVNAQAKADALYIPKGYSSYKDMIDNENLDCIHICTPNFSHFEIAMYAIDHNINVVCEKPITCSSEEAQILCDRAKEKNIVNAINFNCRFYPMVYRMKEMVKSGQVGNIYTVTGNYLQDWLFYDTDYSWRIDPKMSGISRAFADIGSHWIDMAEFVVGSKAVEVLADFEIFHKTRKKPLKPIDTYSGMALKPEDYEEVPISTEDYATVLFHFENGAHGCCNISQVFAGKKNQIELAVGGSKQSMIWNSEDSNEIWIGNRSEANQKLVKDPSILDNATRGTISYPGGHVEGFADTFKQNFKQIYSKILDRNSKLNDFATFEDGLREVILCEKIVESAKEHKWIKLN